jgi:hypothetical protein
MGYFVELLQWPAAYCAASTFRYLNSPAEIYTQFHDKALICKVQESPSFSYETLYTSAFNLLKPTGYVIQQQVQHSTTVRSAHTVFMCFVFIW